MIVSFTLTMPSVNSWNGRWSGESKLHAIVQNVGTAKKTIERYTKLINNGPYYYNFGDGWTARIVIRSIESKEAKEIRKNSDGFCGYNWMIDSIKQHGEIRSS